MKAIILLLAFFIASQAMAFDVCQFKETHEFVSAAGAEVKVSKNHKAFTDLEKAMIFTAIKADRNNTGIDSLKAALDLFADLYQGKIGYNAGEIAYYKVSGKTFALVHYWPGDNEYGAIFEVRKTNSVLLATVSDSWISCL